MWWFLKKSIDTADEVVYTYGRETKEQSGEIRFNKHSEEFSIVKLANNDTMKSAEKLLAHLFRIIFSENCPAERQIAIG